MRIDPTNDPRPAVLLLVLVLALPLVAGRARAAVLAADLSDHLIAIDTGFAGTDLLLFGTVEDVDDVVVVVRGPSLGEIVRRKARTVGIWVNRESVEMVDAPSFYAIASTRPLAEIADLAVRRRHGLGLDVLDFETSEPVDRATEELFMAGLIRNKQKAGAYSLAPAEVRFVGPTLFRTDVHFPGSVSPGHYKVEVLGFRDGQIAAAQSTTLVVSKVGVEAELFDFARQRAELYALIAIAVAVFSGWTAALIFRKT